MSSSDKDEDAVPIESLYAEDDDPGAFRMRLVAIGATSASAVGLLMPSSGMFWFLLYLLGGICGLAVGIVAITEPPSRLVGIVCAVVSILLLSQFPAALFKGGLMGDG